MLDALNELNHQNLERFGDPETATRIAQYEKAFRMQSSVPELTDHSTRVGTRLWRYMVQMPQCPVRSLIVPCWLDDW